MKRLLDDHPGGSLWRFVELEAMHLANAKKGRSMCVRTRPLYKLYIVRLLFGEDKAMMHFAAQNCRRLPQVWTSHVGYAS